jgi:3-oxo-5-alpha-steroid 4-dehydrogenase 1
MFGISIEEEKAFHEQISQGMLVISLPIFLTLYFVLPAPWGKTLSDKHQWFLGPLLPARISWFIFESPNLVWSYVCWRQRRDDVGAMNIFLFSLFVLHYIRRAVIYPIMMSSNTKRMPTVIVLSALCYCCCNG